MTCQRAPSRGDKGEYSDLRGVQNLTTSVIYIATLVTCIKGTCCEMFLLHLHATWPRVTQRQYDANIVKQAVPCKSMMLGTRVALQE